MNFTTGCVVAVRSFNVPVGTKYAFHVIVVHLFHLPYDNLQRMLSRLNVGANSIGLQINVNKTKIAIVRKRK